MITKNFVEKYWKGVTNPISLNIPNESGCKILFQMQWGDDICLLNQKRFVCSLICRDLLVFQYKKGSDFHVIILDNSKLEIDYSSLKYNDDHDFNKHCKQEEESDDDDCAEILNDIVTTSTTSQKTNIDKRKINMNATQQKAIGKFMLI